MRKSKIGRWMQYQRKVVLRRPKLPKPPLAPKFRTSTALQKGVVPPRKRVTLPYCQINLATPPVLTDSVATVQTIRLNSCFDPNFAIGGIQPMGFDQWSAMYKRYTVVSARIIVKCNPTTANYYGGTFGINVLPVTGGSVPVVTSETAAITSVWSTWNTYTQSANATKCVFKWDAAKYFGVEDIMDGDDFTGDTTGSNPNREAAASVWISADVNTQPTSTFTTYVEYDVVFHEPREITES